MTVQVFVDTILLSWHDPREMAASFPAVMWFWLPFGLLQVTAGYTSTFVAQYTGAGRPHRVGPAVWQGIHFAVLAGLLFLLVVPARPVPDRARRAHARPCRRWRRPTCGASAFAALPMLVMAAVNGFFSGRGQTWTVLGIEAFGTAVNVALALVLIFGRLGLPGDGDRGGRLGDRGRVVGVGPAGRRACCCGGATARSSPPRPAGGRSASCSAG